MKTRWLPAAWAALCLLTPSTRAGADPKQRCAQAYEGTQIARAKGRLIEARSQALACSASSCSAYVTRDCATWLAEIEAILPTVVLSAVDATGAAATAVRVTVDGEVLAERLDGEAVPMDPGAHTIQFELGTRRIEEKVVIREGEKNRSLTASFQSAPPATTSAAPSPLPAATPSPRLVPSAPAEQRGAGIPAWVWLSGAGGLSLLGACAGFGVSALQAHRALIEKCAAAGGDLAHCPESTSPETRPLAEQRGLHGGLSLGLGAAGVVAVTAAVIGIVVAPSRSAAPQTSFFLVPMGSPNSGGAQWMGQF